MTVPITRPWFSDAEAAAVAEVLASGWVSQGPRVAAFEAAFAERMGARHAVAVCSCTTGLHLVLVALGIGPGDEVLMPSFTFVATANVVEYCGARPVFADVDLTTFNVDVDDLARRITPATRAIIPVHLFGLSADMDPILALARDRGIAVIEDAACAIGSTYAGRPVGVLGKAGCFSLHPRKIITTGEGGMVTTDDAGLADHLRSLRSHAATVSDLDRHRGDGFLLPAFAEVGFNYRMTDIQAAVGLAQMPKLDTIIARRAELARRYTAALAGIPWLALPQVPDGWVHPFQSYVTLVADDAPIARDEIARRLAAKGIATRQGTHAVHALDFYAKRYGLAPADYPRAWTADRQTLTLPLFPQMSDAEQQAVIDALAAMR